MFNLPEKYKINKKIAAKNFISKDLNADEKKKIKSILKNIILSYQLVGEEIPSVIDEHNNCQVIMFLDIEIDNIKNASYIANIIQPQLKCLAVLNIFDNNMQRYFFANKRLSLQDKNEIVITEITSTKESSLYFYEKWRVCLEESLNFHNIILKENKITFYKEMMTKAIIINNDDLNINKDKLLKSVIWYNTRKVQDVFESIKNLEKCKLQAKTIKETNERVMINKEIIKINEEILNLI
ncbi:DUF4391 domain-containing protein [Clostridium butyricum]|uniref:DUF4391 domain-containing protein n=1 Tax=Clostridium butyricum TaxID=1492 RepID=UPI00374FC88E